MPTIGDYRIIYFNIVGVLNVNSIGVRTKGRSSNVNGVNMNIFAAVKSEVELGAILDSKQ